MLLPFQNRYAGNKTLTKDPVINTSKKDKVSLCVSQHNWLNHGLNQLVCQSYHVKFLKKYWSLSAK